MCHLFTACVTCLATQEGEQSQGPQHHVGSESPMGPPPCVPSAAGCLLLSSLGGTVGMRERDGFILPIGSAVAAPLAILQVETTVTVLEKNQLQNHLMGVDQLKVLFQREA